MSRCAVAAPQVALSVAVLNKQGKILLARQFVEMTRMKVGACTSTRAVPPACVQA